MINDELKSLGLLALTNAFYEDFSALANEYISAGANLGVHGWCIEESLADVVSVYGRDEKVEGDVSINLYGNLKYDGMFSTCGYQTIQEALEDDRAVEIVLQAKKIFKRGESGEWFYCGDEA